MGEGFRKIMENILTIVIAFAIISIACVVVRFIKRCGDTLIEIAKEQNNNKKVSSSVEIGKTGLKVEMCVEPQNPDQTNSQNNGN